MIGRVDEALPFLSPLPLWDGTWTWTWTWCWLALPSFFCFVFVLPWLNTQGLEIFLHLGGIGIRRWEITADKIAFKMLVLCEDGMRVS